MTCLKKAIMKDIVSEIMKNKSRLVVTTITTAFMFIVPFYPEWFTRLPLLIQIGIVILIAVLNLIYSSFPDIVHLAIQHRSLQSKYGKLKSEFHSILKSQGQELDELKDVIVTFLEHSHSYQDKVLWLLKIQGEYLCIAKSSEGLSEVFKKMKGNVQLPFSKVLTEWSGSIKPFENMNLFLLPLDQLYNFKENNIKGWIDNNIIPQVEKERHKFLNELPKRIASLADKFSYKYLAFVIHTNSIEYSTLNRKFNKSLMNTLITTQTRTNVAHMTQALTDIIRTKDFFNIVDWSAFIKLNADQEMLFRNNQQYLSKELMNHSLSTLSDIARCGEDVLTTIYRNAFGSSITIKRATNLAIKTRYGVNRVLTILRNNGVNV